MPAPTKLQIKANIKTSLLQAGYYRKEYDTDGNLKEFKTELMPEMDRLTDCIAQGVSDTWAQWIPTVIVSGTAVVSTAPGTAPVVGTIS